MNRQEHLDWCKKRALEYVNNGDSPNAIASMVSDLGKHPETQKHVGIDLAFYVMNGTETEIKNWIKGFN